MPLFHHLNSCYLLCLLILRITIFLNWLMIYHCKFFFRKNFSVKLLCIIVESTSFRRKIWPSEKCQNYFCVNLSSWNPQTMQAVKSTISYPSANVPMVKLIRRNFVPTQGPGWQTRFLVTLLCQRFICV